MKNELFARTNLRTKEQQIGTWDEIADLDTREWDYAIPLSEVAKTEMAIAFGTNTLANILTSSGYLALEEEPIFQDMPTQIYSFDELVGLRISRSGHLIN